MGYFSSVASLPWLLLNRTKSSSYRIVAMNAFSGKKHNEKSGSQNQILFLESPANSSLLAGFTVLKTLNLQPHLLRRWAEMGSAHEWTLWVPEWSHLNLCVICKRELQPPLSCLSVTPVCVILNVLLCICWNRSLYWPYHLWLFCISN